MRIVRIVMNVFSSDEHYNADAENAYVVLDERLAKVIQGRHHLFDACRTSNPDLLEMYYEGNECRFYTYLGFHDDANGFLPGKEAEEHFEEFGWCEIQKESSFKGDLFKDSFDEVFGLKHFDGMYMVLGPAGFYWEAIPTHTSISLQSETLPYSILARVI